MMQPDTKPQRLSPIHTYHEGTDARFNLQAGWLIPEVYTTPEEESAVLDERVGLADISMRGKLTVKGDLASSVMTARWDDTPKNPGDVSIVNSNGFWIAKLTPDEFLITTTPGDEKEIISYLENAIADQGSFITVLDQTSGLVGLLLQGPKSLDLMSKVCPLAFNPGTFPDLHAAQSSFAKTRTTIIRYDRGDSLAFELYADRSYGGYLWEAILDAGAEFLIQPVGWGALNR